MINQTLVNAMLLELEKCKKEIEMLSYSLVVIGALEKMLPDAYREVMTKTFNRSLDSRKAEYHIIKNLLVLEYEHLEIEPILEQLDA